MNTTSPWTLVNSRLIAKAIGELTFEEVIRPHGEGATFVFTTQSGVTYRFTGTESVWDYIKVDPNSITRDGKDKTDAARFFQDIQKETGMDDIILGNFLEEMHNTLYSDLELLSKTRGLSVHDISDWDGEKLQSILNGHPKILLNKGRIGFSASDLQTYSPESGNAFQLYWIALRGQDLDHDILLESFDQTELENFKEHLSSLKVTLDNFSIMPVHPWQWNRFISVQYAKEIHEGNIIPLGIHGDFYRPQISIRTLSNVSRPARADVKLSLSILNTSCFRGLPANYVRVGKKVSTRLEELCLADPRLSDVKILKEKEGVSIPNSSFSSIEKAPYRYQEYLGCVWRESSAGKIQANEKAILTASLFFQDDQGKSLIGEYIRRSERSPEEWLKALFEKTLVPLYLLQVDYGVGHVAHGQNIVLVMKDYFPTGMILKDFHGDLRLNETLPPKGARYLSELKGHLTSLPSHYLLHDLITGHFITVLRFISVAMKESDGMEESKFYSILSSVLAPYNKSEANLFNPYIERLLLNKVRFNIGYADSDQRPLPILGRPLHNPLHLFQRDQHE